MSEASKAFSGEIGAYLGRHRKKVRELATLLEVSESTISRRLNHGDEWPLDQAWEAAEWAGIDLATLVIEPKVKSA
jgi:hypothetical protein